MADIACVVGFYCRFLTLDPNAFGLERSTDVITVALTSASHWIEFVSPWVGIALPPASHIRLSVDTFGYESGHITPGLTLGLPLSKAQPMGPPYIARVRAQGNFAPYRSRAVETQPD